MPMGRDRSEWEARKKTTFNEQGGIDLVDDGTGRLREKRPTDFHAPDCICIHCRKMCCVLCHQDDPTNIKVWQSLTGFGKHLSRYHPKAYSFDANVRKTKKLMKAIQEVKVAQEIKRAEKRGLRKVPIKAVTDRELRALDRFVQAARKGDALNGGRKMDPLLLTAIEMADECIHSKKDFRTMVRTLTMEVEKGIRTGTFTTSERKTFYDPRISIEILKIMWATGRGWSFVVHLLLLYGLNAFIEGLYTEGLVPPSSVPSTPSPEDITASASDLANEIMFGRK